MVLARITLHTARAGTCAAATLTFNSEDHTLGCVAEGGLLTEGGLHAAAAGGPTGEGEAGGGEEEGQEGDMEEQEPANLQQQEPEQEERQEIARITSGCGEEMAKRWRELQTDGHGRAAATAAAAAAAASASAQSAAATPAAAHAVAAAAAHAAAAAAAHAAAAAACSLHHLAFNRPLRAAMPCGTP